MCVSVKIPHLLWVWTRTCASWFDPLASKINLRVKIWMSWDLDKFQGLSRNQSTTVWQNWMLPIIIIVWPSVLSTVTGSWQNPHIWGSVTRCSHPQLFSIIKQNILPSNLTISSELNKIRNTVDAIYKTHLFHCFAFILSVLCETPAVLLQFWTEGIVALGFLFTLCHCNVLSFFFFFS